jgi:integrase
MALFKRADSKFYWLEFTYAGRRYRVSTDAATKPPAREFERVFRQRVYEEVVLGRRRHEPMRFEDAVRRYASGHLAAKQREPGSDQSLKYMLRKLTALIGPDTVLDDVTTARVADLKEAIFDEGNRKPATANAYLASLRAILRLAHFEWGRLASMPRFKLYPLKNARTRWLRSEEEVRLLNACEDAPHLRDLVIFLVDTGARLGEACGLTWDKVSLANRGTGTVQLFATKTRTARTVPLTTRCDALLQRLYEVRPADQERVFLVRTPGGNWRGTVPQAVPFSHPHGAWKTALKRADVSDFRFHDLRHTYASRLVQRNVPLLTVAELLGHTSIKMTMRYAHLATETLKHAVAKLNVPLATKD